MLLALSLMATGWAQSFGFALAMRFFTGLANGAAYVPAMALGSAWFAMQRRGFATGIVSGGIGAGTMISGLLVPPIIAAQGAEGWRTAWVLLGGISLVIAGWVAVLIRNRPEEKGLLPVGAAAGGVPQESAAGPKTSALNWSAVYRRGAVWYLGLVYFFYGASYIIYMTFFAAYLVKEIGMSPAFAGGLWAAVGALSTFCGILWGGISDRLGRSRGAALAYVVLAVAYAVNALVQSPFGFVLSAVLFGLSAWSIPTIMAAAAGDHLGSRLAPAGLGFITLFFGVGQAAGPALGGRLADASGTFTVPFLLAAAISLAGAAASLFLKKPAT